MSSTIREVSLEQARRELGDIVLAAARDHQVTMLTRFDTPVAYVIPLGMLPHLRDTEATS